MAKVLITSEYFCKFADKARKILTDAGHTVIDNPYGHTFLSPEMIIPYVEEADALVCDLEKINANVLAHAKNLKIIARRGVGVDSVDMKVCKERGIEVARTVGLVEKPVAELVMAYILGFSRKTDILNRDMHAGVWEKVIGHSLFGKTLGIIGMGNIAGEVARRAQSFDMNIVYYDIERKPEAEKKTGAIYQPLEKLLAESDFVTVHMPLNESTRDFIGYKQMCCMKKTAFLINTARGGIVNEEDLAKAASEGKIAGAAIDVFDREPKTDSPLKNCENVVITPHVATFTIETFIAMDEASAQNIVDYFKKEEK